MKYQPLEKELTQNGGHHYTQIWRDENAAVYEQRGTSGKLLGHEVIVVKKAPPQAMFGREYPARELYPSSEDWGRFAWTVKDRDDALERARKVSSRCTKGEFEGRLRVR